MKDKINNFVKKAHSTAFNRGKRLENYLNKRRQKLQSHHNLDGLAPFAPPLRGRGGSWRGTKRPSSNLTYSPSPSPAGVWGGEEVGVGRSNSAYTISDLGILASGGS